MLVCSMGGSEAILCVFDDSIAGWPAMFVENGHAGIQSRGLAVVARVVRVVRVVWEGDVLMYKMTRGATIWVPRMRVVQGVVGRTSLFSLSPGQGHVPPMMSRWATGHTDTTQRSQTFGTALQ